jgi:hypothetical protein
LAKRMLRGRSKHDIIDASYNRYNFHDEGLPEWFEADERKHMRAPKQVRVCMMRLLAAAFPFRSQRSATCEVIRRDMAGKQR